MKPHITGTFVFIFLLKELTFFEMHTNLNHLKHNCGRKSMYNILLNWFYYTDNVWFFASILLGDKEPLI